MTTCGRRYRVVRTTACRFMRQPNSMESREWRCQTGCWEKLPSMRRLVTRPADGIVDVWGGRVAALHQIHARAKISHRCSGSGFVDRDMYTECFVKVFLRYAPTERPLLLLQDGASAHLGINLIDAVIANDVILLCFPPNWVNTHTATVRRRYLSDDEGQRLTHHATDQAATRGDVGEQG